MHTRPTIVLLLGIAAGAAFGTLFGAFASVFHGGPDPLTGVTESWWWFALCGGAMATAWARSYRLDAERGAR